MDRTPWADFLAGLDWQQGEHVTLVGPTGRGKTTLGLALLELRRFAVILGTKPRDRDETLNRMIWRRDWSHPFRGPDPTDWVKVRNWPPPDRAERVIVWPRYRRLSDRASQRRVLADTIDGVFAEGGWCVFCDDTPHLVARCGLGDDLADLWRQGRSLKVSVVAALQRPRHVPLEAYDQATHLFLWRDNDSENVKRLSDLGGDVNRQTIRETVAGLGKHECVYLNTRTGQTAVTRLE